jgi:hypothetical protein
MQYVTWFTRHKNDCFLNFAPTYIQVPFYIHPDWVNINFSENLSCLASNCHHSVHLWSVDMTLTVSNFYRSLHC